VQQAACGAEGQAQTNSISILPSLLCDSCSPAALPILTHGDVDTLDRHMGQHMLYLHACVKA
jgi:hypothetical protein